MDKRAGGKNDEEIIIVRLLGGLGNQMFQYALGRKLSILHKRVLKLDASIYNSENQSKSFAVRNFNLDVFNIKKNFANETDIKPFEKYLGQNFFSRLLRRFSSGKKYYLNSYIYEPRGKNFIFDPHLLKVKLKPIVYIDGFWQTEKYFSDIESVIRKDFTFKDSPNAQNQALLEKILNEQSVGIHIRHGDNATKMAAGHGVLPLEYYYQALKSLKQQADINNLYIFSDDPEWAKQNLHFNEPAIFVANNQNEPHEDMRLMAACKHHIIGNSTFSWWAAWLGKKPGQFVFAPSRYHMNDNISTTDLYPKAWQIININK